MTRWDYIHVAIDGDAQNSLVDKVTTLLQQTQCDGVQPSNFTLQILVKMLSFARNLDGAFVSVDNITSKFQIRRKPHPFLHLNKNSLRRGMQTSDGEWESTRAVG